MPHARGAGYGATRGDGDDDDDEWIRPRTNRRDSRATALGAVATLAIAFVVLISTRFVGPARLGLNLPGPGSYLPASLFNSTWQKIKTFLKGSSYDTATCTSQLQFHGWCESNAVIFSSGCLAQYPGVYYYNVGAPYPVPNSQVHDAFSSCVKTYYKDKIVGDYATYGLTLDDSTANHLVAAMFPESSSYGNSDWVEAFKDADLNAESDFGQDDNFGDAAAEATASVNVNALYKSYLASTTSCEDQYSFNFCPSDLGLRSTYYIRVPKVCASFRIAGKRYKKCISVPTVKFKLPTSCKQVNVMLPGYCTFVANSQKFTAVTEVNSVQGLLDLDVLPSAVESTIEAAMSDAAKYSDQLASNAQKFTAVTQVNSVQGLLDLNVLPSSVKSSIETAMSDAAKYSDQLASNAQKFTAVTQVSSVQGLLDLNVLPSAVYSTIETAMSDAAKYSDQLASNAQKFTAVAQVSSVQDLLDLDVLPSAVKSTIEAAMSDTAKYSAVTQVSSIQGLLDLDVLPSSVKSSIETAMSDAAKYVQLASTTSVDGLVDSDLLNDGVMDVIKEAQSALSDIANGLEDKIRNVVSLMWGNTLSSADEMHAVIENGILDALDSTSAAAALGFRRDHAALYDDIQDALHKAFRGEEFKLESRAAQTERAQLGASSNSTRSRGSCFDLVLSREDSEYEAPSYLMPWPEKLKDDPLAPGSIDIKFPELTTSLCANIAKFNIPAQVAVELFDAYSKMFESLFTELYTQTGLKALVAQIKELGNGKFYGGRRLLSAQDEKSFVEAHLNYKQQFAEAEISVFNQIIKFHERLTVLSLGELVSNRNAPSLGAGAFDAILKQFMDDLKEALKLMADGTEVDGTFTLAYKYETSMKVEQGITQTGEFLSDVLGMENTIEQQKIYATPVPGLLVLVDLKLSLSMPYFFRAETEGEFGVSVEVAFPVDVKISSDTPSVTFGTPTVESKVLGSTEIHVGLQTGVVVQIESAFVALCAGPACAGPELYARQDVYFGIDAFAMTLDRAQATCESEAHSLIALWNDWDYPSTTKSQCTASVAGVGGYLQVPKTELEVRLMLKPIPIEDGGDTGGTSTDDPGMQALVRSFAVQLFDFTPLIKQVYDSSGNFHVQELFSECTAGTAARRDCAPTCLANFHKFKSVNGACLTSFDGNVVMEDCWKDVDDAEWHDSHWWDMIPVNVMHPDTVRIRLSESFSCLTVTRKGTRFLLKPKPCDSANGAQLLEHVDNCFNVSGQDYPCLRTAAVNIHNGEATGSASGRQYVYATNDGRIRLSNSLPSSTKFVIAKA